MTESILNTHIMKGRAQMEAPAGTNFAFLSNFRLKKRTNDAPMVSFKGVGDSI